MKYIVLLLLAGFASCSAIPRNPEQVSTREYARCLEADDRPICYLSLAYKSGQLQAAEVKRLYAEPELADLIGIKTDADNLSRDTPKENQNSSYRLFVQPDREIWLAGTKALELDAAGVAPQEALIPILEANVSLQSRSDYTGQITTESRKEKRIRQYQRILDIYRGVSKECILSQPSPKFIEAMLAAWETDLAEKIRTYTDFNQDKSRRKLASAFAEFGDLASARRVFNASRIDPKRIELEIALSSGDLDAAWRLTKVDVLNAVEEDIDQFGRRIEVDLEDIPSLANSKGNEPLLREISEIFADDEFVDRISAQHLFRSNRFLSSDARNSIGASFERRFEANEFPGTLLAQWWVDADQEQKLHPFIDRLAEKASTCEPKTRCPTRQLLLLLAIGGRMGDLHELLPESVVEAYLSTSRYTPFDIEVKHGTGELSSMDMLFERYATQSGAGSLEYALRTCVFHRLEPSPEVINRVEPDFDGAYHCATKLLDASQMPKSVSRHRSKYDNAPDSEKQRYMFGQNRAANTALLLASQLIATDQARSEFLERSALELLATAPEDERVHSIVDLAMMQLETDGRLTCHP